MSITKTREVFSLPNVHYADISNGIDPQTGKPLQGKAFGYATKDAEVLIDGEIPKEAYTVVKKHH